MADIAIVTGSSGMVGSEATEFLLDKGFIVHGIDNDMRSVFFGDEASTAWNERRLIETYPNYHHHSLDIRDRANLDKLFKLHEKDIKLIVHSAAQPSHDWAAEQAMTDFTVNANGTLVLLELARRYCPGAVFIYMSTNKVYGDQPNAFPFVEEDTRWELEAKHPYYANGIDESIGLDECTHSLFGVSKLAGDLMVQEFGRYFGMKTACFRAGCLTGSGHSGTELHGFLSYLMMCTMKKTPYKVFGYQGKQVRDNIHSRDVVEALYQFYLKPGVGKVYNMGGGRFSNCSMLEAIAICEQITGNKLNWDYIEKPRAGDHIWWISDMTRFKTDYPDWDIQYNLQQTFEEIHDGLRQRL
ncbi:NAD-dependent epimerase/dehydratase family protein [Nitrospina watsonii]|uniref:CDP-tyvelose epimerase n=1 Tax=Nitrospina watsonii TaxID=1323948 RepID=A0ABM9HAT1_9BACT|nr:NAD-dependent epimerase/dehydratase family protein [Nitrospina watsonii]CAI2717227.1 CDP-tyvelose epimerase [Nitrospina watsonii]